MKKNKLKTVTLFLLGLTISGLVVFYDFSLKGGGMVGNIGMINFLNWGTNANKNDQLNEKETEENNPVDLENKNQINSEQKTAEGDKITVEFIDQQNRIVIKGLPNQNPYEDGAQAPRPILGFYGIGLIIDSKDDKDLPQIKSVIKNLNSLIQEVNSGSSYLVLKDVLEDGIPQKVKTFFLVTPRTPKIIKDYVKDHATNLKGSSGLWLGESVSSYSKEALESQLIRWMAENSSSKVWIIYNNTEITRPLTNNFHEIWIY